MVRVLNINECMQAAGIESYIMNVYRNIDKTKIQFDFYITRNEQEFYDEEIKKLGGKKYTTDRRGVKNTFLRVLKESKDLYKFLKGNKYEIIQVHSGTPLRVFYLIAAKKAGVKKRIYHSHSAEVFGPHKFLFIKKIVFKILKQFIPMYATNMFACSKAAGIWMYPKRVQNKVQVVKNGIILDKFIFDKKTRLEYRKKLGLENKIVLGQVARFNHQKNHIFMIEVMKKIVEYNNNIVLLLIGNGELENDIRQLVKKYKLENNIYFLGVRSDVNNLMKAMDIFVLPSNYEGLPVVGIEAQASGLYTLFSSNVTKEVEITKNCKFIDLKSDEWVKSILDYSNIKIDRNTSDEIKKAKYNIESTIEVLSSIYLEG